MPIVTISRMYGSGGSEVAEQVAHALGWDLLDNELVDAVAVRLGVSSAEVSAREERVPSLAERFADALSLGVPEALPAAAVAALPPTDERLLDVTRRVVEEAVSRGPVVLVGRGAQCMLATRSDALHVFCHAPRDALIARATARLGGDARRAAQMVDDTNRQREQYVRRHWNRSWASPTNYHLCLDTAWLGVAGAARLVVELARTRLAGSGA